MPSSTEKNFLERNKPLRLNQNRWTMEPPHVPQVSFSSYWNVMGPAYWWCVYYYSSFSLNLMLIVVLLYQDWRFGWSLNECWKDGTAYMKVLIWRLNIFVWTVISENFSIFLGLNFRWQEAWQAGQNKFKTLYIIILHSGHQYGRRHGRQGSNNPKL